MNKKTLSVAILSIVIILTMFNAYSIREAQADKPVNILVHKYYQNEPQWKNDKLDNCKDKTIGSDGCSLTCWTMVIDKALEDLAIHLKGSGGLIGSTMSYTPEELNNLLNNYRYTIYFDKDGNIVDKKSPAVDHSETRNGWDLPIDDQTKQPVGEAKNINIGLLREAVQADTASRSSNGLGLDIHNFVKTGYNGLAPIGPDGIVLDDTYPYVLDQLRQGFPVLVRVNDNKHSVLITSYHPKVNDQPAWYDVADPWINDKGRNICDLRLYGSRIYEWGIYVFEAGGQPVPYKAPSPYYIDPEHLYDPLVNPNQYGPELLEPLFPYVSPLPLILPTPLMGRMDELIFKFFDSTYLMTIFPMPGSPIDMLGCAVPYGASLHDTSIIGSVLPSLSPLGDYYLYKTGMLGFPWNLCKNNTIKYTDDPALAPDSNKIYYGTIPPYMVNPIFSESTLDFQVLDQIFTYPLVTNPYTTVPGSAITGNPAGGDLPWMAYAWKTKLIDDPTGGTGQWTNVTLWFRNDITWHDSVPFTVADFNYTIYVNALYGDSPNNYAARLMANASNGYAPYFTAWDPYTCSILVNSASDLSLYLANFEMVPEHLYKYIVPSNITEAEEGSSTDGLHGIWPGQAATPDNFLPNSYGITYANVADPTTGKPDYTLIGTGPWRYRSSTNASMLKNVYGGITLDAYHNFFMKIAPGAIAFKYTWLNTATSAQPSGGYYKIGLTDLVLLANTYGMRGTPPSQVPISSLPGDAHTWNPAADLAAPSGVIGLSDMVTLALHYGWCYGNYSYNAPYQPSEIENGGP